MLSNRFCINLLLMHVSSELKKLHWDFQNVTFQETEVNSKRMNIKKLILMLEGGSIFSTSDEDR